MAGLRQRSFKGRYQCEIVEPELIHKFRTTDSPTGLNKDIGLHYRCCFCVTEAFLPFSDLCILTPFFATSNPPPAPSDWGIRIQGSPFLLLSDEGSCQGYQRRGKFSCVKKRRLFFRVTLFGRLCCCFLGSCLIGKQNKKNG